MNTHAHISEWQALELGAHPASRPGTPCRIQVRTRRLHPRALEFEFTLEADLARLRIPARRPSTRADRLWAHTCFEAFVRAEDSPGYVECNFSPSTQWALYRFDGYRQGMQSVTATVAPDIEVHQSADCLQLWAQISLRDATLGRGARDVRLALSAVLEDIDGGISYWALAHPPGKPDFHHDAGFILTLQGTPT